MGIFLDKYDVTLTSFSWIFHDLLVMLEYGDALPSMLYVLLPWYFTLIFKFWQSSVYRGHNIFIVFVYFFPFIFFSFCLILFIFHFEWAALDFYGALRSRTYDRSVLKVRAYNRGSYDTLIYKWNILLTESLVLLVCTIIKSSVSHLLYI